MAMEVKIHKKLGEYELDVHWKSTKKRIGILGASGSGKSLTLKSIAGIEHPDQGHIQIGDHVLYDSDSRICLKPQKRNVGYMFQNYALFPTMTVEQNVAFGLDIKHTPKKKRDEQVAKYLDVVGLTAYKDYYPKQLSTSMLQRVAIARAFATEPELLLMDEPYGQLDIELRFRLEDELVKLWKMTGTTVIFITHNVEEAVYISNRIMVLTNKPTSVKQIMNNDLPRPRDIASPEFVELRNRVTEAIRWW